MSLQKYCAHNHLGYILKNTVHQTDLSIYTVCFWRLGLRFAPSIKWLYPTEPNGRRGAPCLELCRIRFLRCVRFNTTLGRALIWHQQASNRVEKMIPSFPPADPFGDRFSSLGSKREVFFLLPCCQIRALTMTSQWFRRFLRPDRISTTKTKHTALIHDVYWFQKNMWRPWGWTSKFEHWHSSANIFDSQGSVEPLIFGDQ